VTSSSLALAWIVGCSGETRVPPPPRHQVSSQWETIGREAPRNDTFTLSDADPDSLPDYRAPGNAALRLDLLPGRVALPVVEQPEALAEIADEFVVPHKEMHNPKKAARKLKVLVAPLPFAVESDEQSFRPEGMSVTVEGKVVPFGRGPAAKAEGPTWRIAPNGRQVVMSYPTVPPEGSVVVRWPRIKAVLDRHDPRPYLASEVHTAEEFVKTSVTVGGDTWNGLSFVAPTVMEWTVTLPAASPVFEGMVGLEAPPIDEPASDGAALVLTVVAGGAQTEVGRHEVLAVGPPEPWRVDLSPWAGQQVTVRLSADPGPEATFDWLYVAGPVISGAPPRDVRRVVIVALDTTRPDHFGFWGYERPTTPELDRVLGQSLVFDRAWSTAPRTRPSFRSSTTGNLPLQAVGARNIGDVFRSHGFVTAGIVANVHLQPRFDFDDGFDRWSFDGKANARQQVDRGLEWLRAHTDQDAYLFLHFMDPHMAYDAPAAWREKFVEKPTLPAKVQRGDVLGWMGRGTITDEQKAELEGLHDGEMAFMSNQLGRFFAAIDELPGRTLVVVHSDHGEEFWEHGGFEHNHSLYDELVRTVLALRPTGGTTGARLSAPATLMDIAPTLYDAFGFADAPKVDGRSLLPVLAGQEVADRALPVGYLQYAHERWAVVWKGHKYVLHTGTGQEELYDLVADPAERKDLSRGADLEPYRERLRAVHHDLDVGPGFRLQVEAEPGSGPVTFTLPAPALAADVLDPEAVVEHRANVEWGETPRKTPADVGTVGLSADKTTLTWTPGRKAEGILWVRFAEPTAPKVQVTVAGVTSPVPPLPPGGACQQLCVSAGTVVVPPESEWVKIMKARGSADDLEMLCALGYVTEGCEKFQGGGGGSEPRSDDDSPRGEEPGEGGSEGGDGDDH
jgi:arylsulfatase A-like enzyme